MASDLKGKDGESSGRGMVPARPTPADVVPPGQAKPAPGHAPPQPTGKALAGLSLAALGVVYGDIGTSPLYAMGECFHGQHGVPVTTANILGVLSLIFWVLIIIISIEYLVFILRA